MTYLISKNSFLIVVFFLVVDAVFYVWPRFVGKQHKLANVKRAVGDLDASAEKYFAILRYVVKLKYDIERKRNRIELLKLVIGHEKADVSKQKCLNAQLRRSGCCRSTCQGTKIK